MIYLLCFFRPSRFLLKFLFFFFVVAALGLTDCDYYKTDEYNYTKYVDLKNIKDAQPDGYHARIPVYLIGSRDAHVVLSTADSSTPLFVYEFGTTFVWYSQVLISVFS